MRNLKTKIASLLILTLTFTSMPLIPQASAETSNTTQTTQSTQKTQTSTPPEATTKVTPIAIPKADENTEQKEDTTNTQATEEKTDEPTITKTLSTENEVKVTPSDQNARPAFETLDRIETIVYGHVSTGGLIERLHSIETVIFGRELPGTLTERQTSLLTFLEKSMGNQPSLLFKTSIAEWALEQQIHPSNPLLKRVERLEIILSGNTQGGAILPRLEKIYSQLLPEGITLAPVQLPKGTVIKAKLTQTLTVRTVKKGDIISLASDEPLVIAGVLLAPTGSRILGHVTNVRLPGMFGRSSKIDIEIDSLELLGPSLVKLGIGTEAKKATEAYLPVAGAAAASIAGAVLLGPVGLVSGFFIRGSDRQLQEGTVVFVNTEDTVEALGYKIPASIQPIVTPKETVPQGSSTVSPPQQN